MASVLPLPVHSPIQPSLADPYGRSPYSFADSNSTGTIKHTFPQTFSAISVTSTTSLPNPVFPKNGENTPPRLTSRSALSLAPSWDATSRSCSASSHTPRKSSWYTDSPTSRLISRGSPGVLAERPLDSDNWPLRNPPSDTPRQEFEKKEFNEDDWADIESETYSLPVLVPTLYVDGNRIDPSADEDKAQTNARQPLKRWISTLRKRNQQKDVNATAAHQRSGGAQETTALTGVHKETGATSGHRKSLSISSSLGFVTAVKSASITLASVSIAPRSRRRTTASSLRNEKRSSRYSGQRTSFDSNAPSMVAIMDEKVSARSLQRRLILEELIASEESYISDVKALSNVSNDILLMLFYYSLIQMYFTLLAGSSHISGRESIQRAVSQVHQLHDELLAELNKAVTNSCRTDGPRGQVTIRAPKHMRWHSADGDVALTRSDSNFARQREFRHSMDTANLANIASADPGPDTKTVVAVAKVFDKFVSRLYLPILQFANTCR
jgi:hypothetical protein